VCRDGAPSCRERRCAAVGPGVSRREQAQVLRPRGYAPEHHYRDLIGRRGGGDFGRHRRGTHARPFTSAEAGSRTGRREHGTVVGLNRPRSRVAMPYDQQGVRSGVSAEGIKDPAPSPRPGEAMRDARYLKSRPANRRQVAEAVGSHASSRSASLVESARTANRKRVFAIGAHELALRAMGITKARECPERR